MPRSDVPMRRSTEAVYVAVALGASGALLWPRSAFPAVLVLVAAAAALAASVGPRPTAPAASAVTLLAVAATVFARDTIFMPGNMPPVDPRSVWLIVLVAVIAASVTADRWFAIRPASLVTAAVAASFVTPFADTTFYRVAPPILLQLIVLALALVLIAFVPVARWPRRALVAYTSLEPALICLGAWAIAAPFVRDPAVLAGLAVEHFGVVFAVPGSITAAVVSALFSTSRTR